MDEKVHKFDRILGLHSSHKYLELFLIIVGIICIVTGIVFIVVLGKPQRIDPKTDKIARDGEEKTYFIGGIILITGGVISVLLSIYAIHKYEKFKN